MPDTVHHEYRTIDSATEGYWNEKRSRFVAYALPVTTIAEAMAAIDDIRRKHFDARHVCWAYIVGQRERQERANDDGEPNNSAGKPILGQITALDLTNVLVVVVRYFGGVKLGTGGLMVAYRTAAREALDAATIQTHTLYTCYRLTFPFDLINPVMMLMRQYGAITLASDTDTEGYVWIVQIPDREVERWKQSCSVLYRMSCELMEVAE